MYPELNIREVYFRIHAKVGEIKGVGDSHDPENGIRISAKSPTEVWGTETRSEMQPESGPATCSRVLAGAHHPYIPGKTSA